MKNHRDFVWQCDYGEREPVVDILKKLLREQNENQLGMCSLFVNNNPYQLEFFVVLGYEAPTECQVSKMKELMLSVGTRLRTDITFRKMVELSLQSRFNLAEVANADQMDAALESMFLFPDRPRYFNRIPMGPLGNDLPIFLSHSSKDKPFVEDLIPYLNRYGLAVWYDKLNISYGESIVKAVMNGVDESAAVIFFITQNFLNSRWCEEEMESFLNRLVEGDKVLPISVIFPDVKHQDLPRFIKNKRYLKLEENINPSVVAGELVPAFREFFGL